MGDEASHEKNKKRKALGAFLSHFDFIIQQLRS
ncbi:Hypothetical protein Bdt_2382 [Bdellovibrio bacteriovorus str. Tiberius]|uniref:Uncharacterized protein n=1 Tax=Bdellovibrio bacteriovorus str. Tiberius TaxID=1069642 RepID=K7YZD0_BDEBC|nr:Hypothetical protein Bdt_2382 [Bdellovibrio bacteriovorus str. Tiberius]